MRLLRVIIILLLLTNFPKSNAQENEAISPRAGSRMVVDTENNQVIMFGGYTVEDNRKYYDDTWIFSPIDYSWTHLLIEGPSPRGAHSMAYNPEQNIILLFGGQSGSGRLGDTWIFDCSSEKWSKVETKIAPEGRSDSDIAFDPVRHIFILYGGWGDRTGLQSDTWMFDPMTNAWSEYETDDAPGPMYGQRLEYGSKNERVMLYGGHLRSPVSREYIEDIWYFYPDNSSWIKSNSAYKPHGRYWNALAFSTEHSSLVVFGGTYGEGALGETWILNTDTMNWTQLDSLESPSRRVISDMVYIESIDSFLLFGGGGLIENNYQQYNDTWLLDPTTWTWTQVQTSYTMRERSQMTERGIPGYTTFTVCIGIGLMTLLKRKLNP